MDSKEHLEVVDERGKVIGYAPRSVVHGNPSLIHRVVSFLRKQESSTTASGFPLKGLRE